MRSSAVAIAERQKRVIQLFCEKGPGYGSFEDAAGLAGGTEIEARKVFSELCKKPFSASLEIFDVNKPFLAAQCRQLLKDEKIKSTDKVILIKLLLKTMGEATEDAAQTVNVNTPKALVIVGGNQKKLNAMLAPKQLTDG